MALLTRSVLFLQGEKWTIKSSLGHITERFKCPAKKFKESKNVFNSFKGSTFDLRDLRGHLIQAVQVTDGKPGA